jgi:hypothetical protein
VAGWSAELSFEKFLQLKPTIAAADGTNEDTTRLRAIDTVLFDVLGWDKLDVETELYCRAEGFADYALSDGLSICWIVEAKKTGETFVLPNREYPAVPIGFPLLARECPAAESALRQALGYAASTGARYIAITNGFQWLLTLTFVQNQPVMERSVYVFESLAAIEKKFRLFWDCFSPEGMLGNRAANALLECRKAPAPNKLAHRILNYPAPASRNEIANELSTVLGVVWDEVRLQEEEEAFLKECYVEPEASEASIAQATELLERRLSTDEKTRSALMQPTAVPILVDHYSPEKPIVVLGRVGHGKSTFLR